LTVGANAIERAETDQTIATADIEDDVARPECGAVEDAIATPLQGFDEIGRKIRPALATLANPERPTVFRQRAPTLPSPRGGGDLRI
jgi:hypothetical protein